MSVFTVATAEHYTSEYAYITDITQFLTHFYTQKIDDQANLVTTYPLYIARVIGCRNTTNNLA